METKVNLELDKFDRPLLDEDSGIELSIQQHNP